MNDLTTAEIIAFPVRPPRADVAQSTQRLAAALSDLSVALKEQGQALHRWRDALRALSQQRGIGPSAG